VQFFETLPRSLEKYIFLNHKMEACLNLKPRLDRSLKTLRTAQHWSLLQTVLQKYCLLLFILVWPWPKKMDYAKTQILGPVMHTLGVQ
jgi:hypothetical protein